MKSKVIGLHVLLLLSIGAAIALSLTGSHFFTIGFFAFSSVRYLFFKRAERVKTYTSDLFAKLNIGFFLTLFLIIVAINVGVGPERGFALLVGLYAFWVLVYGTALNFRPSIIASFIMWGIAFGCLFIDDFRWIMLLHGLAVLCGYIIPGHIAYREFKKVQPVSYN